MAAIVKKHQAMSGLVALSLIVLFVYLPQLPIPYYEDDFAFVFKSPSSKVLDFFFHKAAHNRFYRPIEASLLAIIQSYFGTNTWPIHITQIAMHILLCLLIFISMVRLGFSTLQASLGSSFMAMSQANVHAILSNDTLSQVGGTLFGCISLWLLYTCPVMSRKGNYDGTTRWSYTNYYLSVVMLFVSLLSKESSVSFLPMLLGLILYQNLTQRDRTSSIKRAVMLAVPYCAVTVLYLVVRSFMVSGQPSLGAGRYDFYIGGNILENIAMLSFSGVVPTSSVSVFLAFQNSELARLAVVMVITLVFVGFVAYGLWYSRPRATIVWIGILTIIGFFPMAMLNHVSELYVYNSMPFISVLVGIGMGGQMGMNRSNRSQRILIGALVVLLFASHVQAIQSKASLMKENGERATRLLEQIEPYARAVPKNGYLGLLNPASKGIEYSVFVMNGFNVLAENGLHRVKQVSGRYDLTIEIIDQVDLKQAKRGCDFVVLSLYDETVRIYEHNESICG